MSDQHLRELERRWQETGALEDEVALFVERVRVGELTERWLWIAAHFGSDAASVAIGKPDLTPPHETVFMYPLTPISIAKRAPIFLQEQEPSFSANQQLELLKILQDQARVRWHGETEALEHIEKQIQALKDFCGG